METSPHRGFAPASCLVLFAAAFLCSCTYKSPIFNNYRDPNSTLTFADLPITDSALLEALNAAGQREGVTAPSALKTLDANGKGIASLEGLQYVSSLEDLYLDNNKISDLSPIKGLKTLKRLSLGQNLIVDASPLKSLTSLESLYLWNNSISDGSAVAAAISAMPNLAEFSIDANKVANGNELLKIMAAKASIKSLHLNNSGVSDISCLSSANAAALIDLSLGWESDSSRGLKGISDISPLISLLSTSGNAPKLQNLTIGVNDTTQGDALLDVLATRTSMTGLNVNGCGVSDSGFAKVASLAALTYIDVSNNAITSLEPLRGLSKLTSIWVGNNKVVSLEPLVALVKQNAQEINGIGVGDNPITSGGDAFLAALSGNTKITSIDLSACGITDISALSTMTALTNVSLAKNLITDIGALAGLKGMRGIGLYQNRIQSVAPLASVLAKSPDIDYLDLSDNKDSGGNETIGDIATVMAAFKNNGFARLTSLHLNSCGISDISALSGLTALTSLSLGNNKIVAISAVASLTNLTDLALWNNAITDISPLKSCTRLKSLYLDGNAISGGLKYLYALTSATTISLWNNKGLGEDEVAALRAALPSCAVNF